jgi:hypothetical protein
MSASEDTSDAVTLLANPASLAAGVQVTIIDLGLARMDGYKSEARWSEPEEEIFEGEGERLTSSVLEIC